MSRTPSLLGAEGARELIAFLSSGRAAAGIERSPDAGSRAKALRLTAPPTPAPAVSSASAVSVPSEPDRTVLRRHVLEAQPEPAREVRPAISHDEPGTVLLTNSAEALAEAGLASDAMALVPGESSTRAGQIGGLRDHDDLSAAVAGVVTAQRTRHVRVLVDLRDVTPGGPGWAELLRLHDAVFLAAQNCAGFMGGGNMFAVVLVGGTGRDQVPHPATGLFTGLAAALAHELDAELLVLVHDTRDTAVALRDLAVETAHARESPVVHHIAGQRSVVAARLAPVQDGPRRLGRDSVVVAAGGGRGIGAAMLAELARTSAPRIFVLGSNAIDDVDPELLAAQEFSKAEFIKRRTTGDGKVSVAAAKAEFQRIAQAREISATLARLAAHCGPDRVHYLACDLRDPDSVESAIGQVHASAGTVELLLNIAGTTKSAALGVKSLDVFRSVRDLKLCAYVNLKRAFGDRLPRRWLNCGSLAGAIGLRGEMDYSAANGFLFTAAQAAAARGLDEFTMGWGLWDETGMAADPFLKSVLSTNGELTPMPTAEGVRHFAAELTQEPVSAMTAFVGEREEKLIKLAGADARQPSSPAERTLIRTLDPVADPYLAMHLVDGTPTVPGFFVPELATAAAAELAPGRVPVLFEDLRFGRFLRVHAERPVRLRAELVTSDERESVVRVRVLADVQAPNGRVLVRDREHFSVSVRLRDEPLPAPEWQPWREFAAQELPDPYCTDNPLVRLDGVFRCTQRTRSHPLGARAHFELPAEQTGWLAEFRTPAVLLDGMVRLMAIRDVHDGWTPLFVPSRARRVELFATPTDLSVTRAGGAELYSSPGDNDLESDQPNQAVAVDVAGKVIARVHDVRGVVRGYLHRASGEFVDAAEFDARRGQGTIR